jgi:hypothetical protein
MKRTLRRLCAVSIVLAARAAQAGPADVDRAAGNPEKEAARQDAHRNEALQRFTQGTALFEQGRYEAALHAFESSFSLYRTRAALKNQALCLEHLGRFSDALDVLEALPGHFPTFSPEERGAYDAKLRELSERVGFIEVRGADAGWEIRIDGRVRGTTPLPNRLRVSPGLHRIELYEGGSRAAVETLGVRAGKIEVLELGAVLRASKPAATAKPLRPAAPARRSSLDRRPTWLGVDASALASTHDLAAAPACDASCDTSLAFGGRAAIAAGYAFTPVWNVTLHAGYLRLVQDVEQRDVIAEIRSVGEVPSTLDQSLTLSGVVLGAGLERRVLPSVALKFGAGAWLLAAHERRRVDVVLGAGAAERVEQTQRVRGDFVFASLGVLVDHGFGDALRMGLGIDVTLAHALRRPEWASDALFESSAGLGRFRGEALTRQTLLLLGPSLVARYSF